MASSNAQAAETDNVSDGALGEWYVQAGSYFHYTNDEDYSGARWFMGVEHLNEHGRITGLSVFNNSFGQFSQYLYVGKTFHPFEKAPNFRVKLTGGIVHGYKGEHKETSPIHWGDSWALGVVPAVGYQRGHLGIDVAVLSASGMLFLVGYEF
jgi:hypothetical protein